LRSNTRAAIRPGRERRTADLGNRVCATRSLLKNRSSEKLSAFLASSKTEEFDPLRSLEDKVPWEAFLSNYYRKLRHAVRDSHDPTI
jgi:hypothetical protein